jgi:hypothetical protein
MTIATQPKSTQISTPKHTRLTYSQTFPILFYNHEAKIHLYQRWTPMMIELLHESTCFEHSIKTMPPLPNFRPLPSSDTEISGSQDFQKLPSISDTFAIFPPSLTTLHWHMGMPREHETLFPQLSDKNYITDY